MLSVQIRQTALIRAARRDGVSIPISIRSLAHPSLIAMRNRSLNSSISPPQLIRKHQTQSICMASKKDEVQNSPSPPSLINPSSIGIMVLWAALLAYAVLLSPNQTPYRDQIFVKLLVGITKDDSFNINPVFFSTFNLIGIYTFYLQCLLIPGGRSGNKIPAWPFVMVGYFLGSFALLPYFALWRPDPDLKLPPKKDELDGLSKLAMRGAETTILPLGALIASTYLVYNAATADSQAWVSFLGLFDESRLVHVSTIDLMILAALTPFWMSNDAQLRGWKDRDTLVPILSLLPAIGPALYLVLRPKAGDDEP